MRAVVVAFVILLWSSLALSWSAQADVVRSPPKDCPEGYTPKTGHGGPYCQPPMPTTCPKEHIPRLNRSLAYCEPPPEKACPTGSSYRSRSATDTFCVAGRDCTESECPSGATCKESSLCSKLIAQRRSVRWEVKGECKSDKDCSDGYKCETKKRCDFANKRVASSPEAAKPHILPSATPATTKPSTPGSAAPASSTDTPKPSSTGCATSPVPSRHAAVGWLVILLAAARRRYSLATDV